MSGAPDLRQPDLRQGVTATQHRVLDLAEKLAAGSLTGAFDENLHAAQALARNAARCPNLARKLTMAIGAAAQLIEAADQIQRLIGQEFIGEPGT